MSDLVVKSAVQDTMKEEESLLVIPIFILSIKLAEILAKKQ